MYNPLPTTFRGWLRMIWEMAVAPPIVTVPPVAPPIDPYRSAGGAPRRPWPVGYYYNDGNLPRRARIPSQADAASYKTWGARVLEEERDRAIDMGIAAAADAKRYLELYTAETAKVAALEADIKRDRLVLDQQRIIIGNERQRADTAELALKACLRANASLRGGGAAS